jgi:leader peptidase (prepilin peptidase)/N-methyltransferase
VNLCYRRLRGRDGLGRGDAKLLAAGGAWLGWSALPWVVLLAALLGLLLALLQRLRGERLTAETAVPFGPALALAIWLIWIYGLPID